MKERPSYGPNRTYLLPELGERMLRTALTRTRTGKSLHPHGLLTCQEGSEAAALAREKTLLDRGERAGDMAGNHAL